MKLLPCPYLKADVELSDERTTHILRQHPELPAEYVDMIAQTLLDPDEVRTDPRFPRTRLFSRWIDSLLQGKMLIVAIVTDEPVPTQAEVARHWVVTAYPARRVTQGVIEWSRP
jgi:hypothetical protein